MWATCICLIPSFSNRQLEFQYAIPRMCMFFLKRSLNNLNCVSRAGPREPALVSFKNRQLGHFICAEARDTGGLTPLFSDSLSTVFWQCCWVGRGLGPQSRGLAAWGQLTRFVLAWVS